MPHLHIRVRRRQGSEGEDIAAAETKAVECANPSSETSCLRQKVFYGPPQCAYHPPSPVTRVDQLFCLLWHWDLVCNVCCGVVCALCFVLTLHGARDSPVPLPQVRAVKPKSRTPSQRDVVDSNTRGADSSGPYSTHTRRRTKATPRAPKRPPAPNANRRHLTVPDVHPSHTTRDHSSTRAHNWACVHPSALEVVPALIDDLRLCDNSAQL